ncbi:retrovirus-related pol polyprotein from transposon TNT 1-94 [Tanacetum coccineum]
MFANDNHLEYAKMEQSYIDEYSRCVKHEVEISKKNDIVEKDVYNELSKWSLRLKQHYINLEITVQQMKESLRNKKPCNNQDAPEFPEFFKINELKPHLQKKNTIINNLKDHIASLKGKSLSDCTISINNSCVISPGMYKLDLEPLSPKLRKNREAHVDYLKKAKEHADTLCDIIEQARAQQPLDSALDYACKFTTCIQELLVYVSATCPSSLNVNEKLVAITPMNKSKKVRSTKSNKKKNWKPTGKVFTNVGYRWIPTGCTFTIDGSKCPLTRITSTTVVPPKMIVLVVQIVLWYLDSGCSKHMTGQCTQFINFVSKFMGIVRFGNDHVAAIMGDGDYQIGNLIRPSPSYGIEGKSKKHTQKPKSEDFIQEKLYLLHMDLGGPIRIESINGKKYILVNVDDYSRFTWVKFLQSKDETPEFIIKFLKQIQVRLNATVRNICTDNGTEFVNQTLKTYYEDVGILHQNLVARTPQ